MNCPIESRNPEMLVAYPAGELDLETASAVERHLAQCPACRSLAADQATVWKALDAWEAPRIALDFDQRLFRRIREEVRFSWWERISRPFRPLPFRQALPLTVSACLLLMAGLVLQHPGKIGLVKPRHETVRLDQVERTLDDLELLRQVGMANQPENVNSHAM
ncbi:MAG: zf-HC2 domain-containing protein [Bryobacteraceae bacterium]|jgi:anti-sigma factor RsiW